MGEREAIPLCRPDLAGNEQAYVAEAIDSTRISSTGIYVERFEAAFAALCASTEALAVCNGTSALHLVLAGLGLSAGDEVIVPSLSYVAAANAVRYLQAEPVFAEIDPATWCLDPLQAEALITPRTKGIIAVHLYGHPADMDAINRLAARHGLWVVEDAAEAHLARYKGRPVGSLATAAAFSFYGNKILTAGEGGAVTLGDPELAARLRMLRGQGMDPERRYYFPLVGYNFRLSNIACALLCAQLERVPAMLERRLRIFEGYRRRLSGIPGLGFQPQADWATPAPWLYCITVDERNFGRSRDGVMAHLQQDGIETRPFFIPLHSLPPYREAWQRRGPDLAVTDRVASQGINLPTFTAMTDGDLDRIAESLRAAAR